MNPNEKTKAIYLKVAETAIIILITFLTCYFNIFGSFEKVMTDKLYQKPRGINNKIKIIAIDNRTLREYGAMGTWSRSVYADVINTLGDYPDVIAMDLTLSLDMDKEGDKALHDACASHRNVVAACYINYNRAYRYREDGTGYIDNYNIESIDMPIMSDVCESGFVNAMPDTDGVIRSAMLACDRDGEELYSLSYKAYKMYCEKNGIEENVPELEQGRMNIQYAGKPGNYEIIPLCSVLDGEIDLAAARTKLASFLRDFERIDPDAEIPMQAPAAEPNAR